MIKFNNNMAQNTIKIMKYVWPGLSILNSTRLIAALVIWSTIQRRYSAQNCLAFTTRPCTSRLCFYCTNKIYINVL